MFEYSVKALIQRVTHASVTVADEEVGSIGRGILLLLGIDKNDTEADADKLLKRVLGYRIFPDQNGKMNFNLGQVEGGLLVVSQFTLVADTNKGLRPGFSVAASAEKGEYLYSHFVNKAKESHQQVSTGRYGADMQVKLLNDGPVTFMLDA